MKIEVMHNADKSWQWRTIHYDWQKFKGTLDELVEYVCQCYKKMITEEYNKENNEKYKAMYDKIMNTMNKTWFYIDRSII